MTDSMVRAESGGYAEDAQRRVAFFHHEYRGASLPVRRLCGGGLYRAK